MKIKISTRIVFIFKKYVLKFPIDRRGFLQGKNEKMIWEKYQNCSKLCPLKWERFGIVCQEKCDPIEKNDFNLNTVLEIKNRIKEFQFKNCDLYNRKNWGMIQGNQVLCDYGINEKISKMY